MAVTRLKRKAKRNKQTASIRRATIQQLTAKPVIKNVDVEAVKASFTTAPEKAVKAKKETSKVEEALKVEETPKAAKKKPAAKKATPKKEAKEEK